MTVPADVASQPARVWHAPPISRLAVEGARATAELSVSAAVVPFLRRAPRGDGHPVLVLPGFTAGDHSTRPLRWFLRDRGYFVHGWRLGRNLGPTRKIFDGMRSRIEALLEMHHEPVSVVGWSLGGIYAREMARSAPEAVRSIITLGSPFGLTATGRATNADALFRSLSHLHHPEAVAAWQIPDNERPPVPVPSSAVFTRTDAVVPWPACVDEPRRSSTDRRESIEVRGSHSGLGHNPAVLLLIADRLSQPAGQWKPFIPTNRWRRLGGVGPRD